MFLTKTMDPGKIFVMKSPHFPPEISDLLQPDDDDDCRPISIHVQVILTVQ